MLGIGQTIAESDACAQQEVNSLLNWAKDNAVAFDTNKSEVIRTPGRSHKDPVEIQVNRYNKRPVDHYR